MTYNFNKQNHTKYVFGIGYLILFLIPVFMVTHNMSIPGIYYDEVIQATPAMEFLYGSEQQVWEYSEKKSIEIFERPFPWMCQSYMGALKSQVLIPVFAVFKPTAASLRMTTLAIAVIGLLVAMIWSYRIFGLPTVLIFGLFVIYDPCFLFISKHDWGSFALGFLCRAGSLWFITNGWKKLSCIQFFAGGCFLGLGIYNKLDFAVYIIAVAMALAIGSLKHVFTGLRIRVRGIICCIAGSVLCALPLLYSMTTPGSTASLFDNLLLRDFSEYSEKISTAIATFNGSYFNNLMLSGGMFESMFSIKETATSPFLIIFICCTIILGTVLLIDKKKGVVNVGHSFVFFVTIFIIVGIFLLPGAVRIHHVMNVYPFAHLLVALLIVRLFKAASIQKLCRYIVASLLIVVILAGNLYLDAKTLSTINRTGGKGRWSESLDLFANELKQTRPDSVISLDWGFHGQLSFANVPTRLVEPIWAMQRGNIIATGTSRVIYLIHEPEYSLFPYGGSFLAAIHRLPPDIVTITKHSDRQGEPSFISISINRPHRIRYVHRPNHITGGGDFYISLLSTKEEN